MCSHSPTYSQTCILALVLSPPLMLSSTASPPHTLAPPVNPPFTFLYSLPTYLPTHILCSSTHSLLALPPEVHLRTLILHSYSLTPLLTLFHLRLLSHSCSPQSPLHSHSHVHPLTLPLALLLFPTCTRRTHSHSYLFLTCTPVPIHIYSCTSTMFLSPHLLSGTRLPKCLCFLLHV